MNIRPKLAPQPTVFESTAYKLPHESIVKTPAVSMNASEGTVVEPAHGVALKQHSPPELDMGTLSTTSANDVNHTQTKIFAEKSEDSTTGEWCEQNRYIVGPLLDPLFFLYRHQYLPGNRGPFRTSREWMAVASNELGQDWSHV